MELKYGLRLPQTPRLALVGAGGKTTAMFQLAREFQSTVLVTTTTHLARTQKQFADRHFIVHGPADLPLWQEAFEGQVLLFTGPELDAEPRLGSVSDEVIRGLLHVADHRQLPLLMEADGARRLPLKAPADHEPPIPPFADHVMVLAGLSALGQPFSEETVHRPEVFGKLTGLSRGETIGLDHLMKALLSNQGGLKNIPPKARKIVLLNQAETVRSLRDLDPLVASLLTTYDAVGVTAMEKGKVYAVHEPVAGVVLAAGGSERYGESKQLLSWEGETFVHRAARTALEAGLAPVLVVTGAEGEQVQAAVEDLEVRCIHNPAWREGQSTSVRKGVQALPPFIAGSVFMLADQPHIPSALVRELRAAHAESHAPIVATQIEGRRANPVLFDRDTFPDLMRLEGDVGGRVLFDEYAPVFVPWEEPKIKLDVDTPEDYRQLMDQGDDTP